MVPMIAEGVYKKILAEAKRQKKDKLLQRMIKVSNFLLKFLSLKTIQKALTDYLVPMF